MRWFKPKPDQVGPSLRHRIIALLGMTSSFLMIFLIISVGMTGHTFAQQKDSTAVLATKIDDMQASQKDLKEYVSSLAVTVADLRDQQSQQKGMLLGFGGLAALLQIVNTVLQFRGEKNAKG